MKWFLGGDLNDIRRTEEKQGGRVRSEDSFRQFRDFIATMDMGEIPSKGRLWTWANNREEEGFVEEKLDRFFASPDWLLEFPTAQVLNVEKQSSDHSLLILDFKPTVVKPKKRFYFDNRNLDKVEVLDTIRQAWNQVQ